MSFWQRIVQQLETPKLMTELLAYLPKLLAASGVLLAFWAGYAIAKRMLRLYFGRASVPPAVGDMLVTLMRYGFVAVGVLTAADQLGFEVRSLLAGLGIVGLAVSFAAQDTIANVIAGITIVVDKPFKVGDWVEVGGINALVTRVELRTTTLTTFDNQTIVLPNRQIARERIVNYTLVPRIRVRVPVGVAYGEDIQATRQVMLGALADDPDARLRSRLRFRFLTLMAMAMTLATAILVSAMAWAGFGA